MNKSWLIGGAIVGCLTAASLGACGSNSSGATTTTASASASASGSGTASSASSSASTGAGGTSTSSSAGTGGEVDGGATTTIAAARAASVTTPITVDAVVTALHGTVPNDVSQWYIEDPAGGPLSGVAVYCDPDLPSCPTLRAPPLQTLVRITGALSTYKGVLQFVPTAQAVLQMNAPLPPIATVTMTDLAPSAASMYRGVLVHLASKLTVDSVTPPALYDTQCNTGATDGGLPLCTGCSPPTYAGFQANDGMGHEVYVEAFFFATDHLQSSPECTTQAGEIPVTVGMTFSAMTGVLDFDPYAGAQALSPVTDTDYTTP